MFWLFQKKFYFEPIKIIIIIEIKLKVYRKELKIKFQMTS